MLITFKESSLKSAGADNSKVSEVKKAGQKAALAEQGSSFRIYLVKEMYAQQKQGQATGGLQRCSSPLYRDAENHWLFVVITILGNTAIAIEGMARLELKLASTVRDNKKGFLSMLTARRGPELSLIYYLVRSVTSQTGM